MDAARKELTERAATAELGQLEPGKIGQLVQRSQWWWETMVKPRHHGWYEVAREFPEELTGFRDSLTEPKPRARWTGAGWADSELGGYKIVSWRGILGYPVRELPRDTWSYQALRLMSMIELAHNIGVLAEAGERALQEAISRKDDRLERNRVQIERLEKRHAELTNVDKCWSASREINARLSAEVEGLVRENERLKQQVKALQPVEHGAIKPFPITVRSIPL